MYQGHKNWNHWNVSLWINNDGPLYRMACNHVAHNATLDAAALAMLEHLHENGITETPDGAPYSVSSIRAAMVGM
jgi:hypothetical protein